jgi:hypothetical protein
MLVGIQTCGVENHGAAHDAGVGTELVDPQTVADYCHRVAVRLGVFVGKKKPARGRSETEDIKIIGAD